MSEEKKNIFEQAVNALSSRDEKEALEAAKAEMQALSQQLAAAQQAAAAAQAAAAKAHAEAKNTSAQTQTSAQQAIEAANQRAAQAEEQAKKLKAQLDQMIAKQDKEKDLADIKAAFGGAAVAAAKPKVLTEHEMKADETLGHLALKYYGHATPTYWKLIYEANKEAIGDNPNQVKVGLKLQIPELPEELKGK